MRTIDSSNKENDEPTCAGLIIWIYEIIQTQEHTLLHGIMSAKLSYIYGSREHDISTVH